ncbi:MAG: TIGR04255 family protein, partial [Gammaproteobacteria bacterium]
MTNDRRYRNPPVVEALCEIYLKESAWDDTVPGQFYDRMKHGFPVKRQREIQEANISFSIAGEAAAGIRRLPPWIQFVTESGDRMIQLARDLLVVNQLRPYPHFDDWEPAIYSALEVYRELAMPKAVARLGVRYINRVVIPEPRIRMEEYFTLYPQLPQAMGDAHG